MKPLKSSPASNPELRTRARVRQLKEGVAPKKPANQAEMQRLVQELQIHQIELEMQNEELSNAKLEVDAALEKFVDLYEFAPVGYLSLDTSGTVIDANLTLARMMGVERSGILGRRFSLYVPAAQRTELADFLARVFTEKGTESCEVTISKAGSLPFWAYLESKVSSVKHGKKTWCGIAVIDITDRKKAADAQHKIELLEATNRKLGAEIIRRQKLEVELVNSERVALDLVEESQILQERLRQVSHRSLMIEEEQRKKISRSLHDEISQLLVGINAHLEAFSKAATFKPETVRQSIEPFRRLVSDSLGIVHRFAGELRPAMLDDIGLIPALKHYIANLPQDGGRSIHLSASEAVETLSNDKRTVLYRITQEALTNIIKHSGASRVRVTLQKTATGIRFAVRDNGKAFDLSLASTPGWRDRFGLIGMRERVEMVGGTFSIDSVVGLGTTISAHIPYSDLTLGVD